MIIFWCDIQAFKAIKKFCASVFVLEFNEFSRIMSDCLTLVSFSTEYWFITHKNHLNLMTFKLAFYFKIWTYDSITLMILSIARSTQFWRCLTKMAQRLWAIFRTSSWMIQTFDLLIKWLLNCSLTLHDL